MSETHRFISSVEGTEVEKDAGKSIIRKQCFNEDVHRKAETRWIKRLESRQKREPSPVSLEYGTRYWNASRAFHFVDKSNTLIRRKVYRQLIMLDSSNANAKFNSHASLGLCSSLPSIQVYSTISIPYLRTRCDPSLAFGPGSVPYSL